MTHAIYNIRIIQIAQEKTFPSEKCPHHFYKETSHSLPLTGVNHHNS